MPAKKSRRKPANKGFFVRMPDELYKTIEDDARKNERTPPAMIRLIIKDYYGIKS